MKDVRGELATQTGTVQTYVTPGITQRLAEEYVAGTSAKELARKYGIDKSTIWRHLAKAGVYTGQHFMSRNKRLVAEVKVLHEAGLTLRQIAARLEFPIHSAPNAGNVASICRALCEAGVR